MRPQISYGNAHDTAEAVCRAIAGRPPRDCMILPRSRFSPDSTMWWVVPGKESPAYRYGKLYFDQDSVDESSLLSGLHVEKGLAAKVPGAAGHAMDKRWTWSAFFSELGGQVDAQLATLELRAGEPPHVRLLAHLVTDHAPSYELSFTYSKGLIQLHEASPIQGGFLAPLVGSTTLGELRDRITALRQLDWHWLNIFVGCAVRTDGDPAARETWDATMLWESLLSCWQPWFR